MTTEEIKSTPPAQAIVVAAGEGAAAPSSPFHYKATAQQTHGAYALLEVSGPAGNPGPPPHRHPNEEESWYVIEGELLFTVEGSSFRAPSGTFVLVPRGLSHTFRNAGPRPVKYLLRLSPPPFADMFREIGSATLQALHSKYGIEPGA